MRPTGPSTRYSARLYRRLDEVEPTWRELEATGSLTAFQQLAWTRAMCDWLVAPETDVPIFVVVTEQASGRAVMLLPMLLVKSRTHSKITWLDLGVSDYSGPILASGAALDSKAAQEAWACACGVLPAADFIHISLIPARIGGVANPLAALPSCRPMEMQAFAVGLTGDPETLIQRLMTQSSTFREIKRRRRKLAEHGEVAVVAASTPDEVDRIFDALLDQRRERFQMVGRFSLLDRPKVAAFYRAAAHDGLTGGPVRLFGLSVDGIWIATVYGLLHDNAFHMVIPTMSDGEWRIYAPGLQLIAAVMEWSQAQGLDKFDFTIGYQRFKTDLGGTASDLHEVYEAITLKGQVLTRGIRAVASGKAWIKRRPALFAALRDQRQRLRRWSNIGS